MADEDFLRRWARRKSEARQGGEPAPQPVLPSLQPATNAASPVAVAGPVSSGAAETSAPASLPDPALLEPGAEISAFMAKGVDDLVRRKALKTLFSDPHFNVMDRMDVYIDDYSIADPLPPDWLDKLEQVTHLGDKAGRDRAEAERQAALDAQADGGRMAEANQARDGMTEALGSQEVDARVTDEEPEVASGHPSIESKPEPRP